MTLKRTMHPITRAKERYDVDLEVSDLVEIRHMIKRGETMHKSTDQHGIQQHVLRYAGVMMVALWDPNVHRVVTFLAADNCRVKKTSTPSVRREVQA